MFAAPVSDHWVRAEKTAEEEKNMWKCGGFCLDLASFRSPSQCGFVKDICDSRTFGQAG